VLVDFDAYITRTKSMYRPLSIEQCFGVQKCCHIGLSRLWDERAFGFEINMHSQVMFEALKLMSLLINLLATRWFQWKSEEQQDNHGWLGLRAQSRNLGGRCLKKSRQRMEGDGNARLILFQTRVLLEVFYKKQYTHLASLLYAVRLKVMGIMLRLGLMCIQIC
jgi:hypothetical protein